MTIKIGEKIKVLRKRADINQEQFAEYLGVTAQAVSRWEVEGCYPDIELLPSIANFFNISIDELLCFDIVKNQERIDKIIDDTQPDLNKYEHGPVEMHDDTLVKLLYIISRGIPFEHTGFETMYLEDIPHLTECGILGSVDGKPLVNLPMMHRMNTTCLTKSVLSICTGWLTCLNRGSARYSRI